MKNKLVLLTSICLLTALPISTVAAETLQSSSPQEEWQWRQEDKVKLDDSNELIEAENSNESQPNTQQSSKIPVSADKQSSESIDTKSIKKSSTDDNQVVKSPTSKTNVITDESTTSQTQEEGEGTQTNLLEKDDEIEEVELVTPEVPKQVVGWYYDEAINNYVYRHENGQLQTGWYYDNDYHAYYYFYQNGVMKKGWHTDPDTGAKYYLNASGAMEKGWYFDQESAHYYYFRQSSGAMERGWFYDNDYHAYYYFQANGIMKTGWHIDPTYGGTYFFNTSGAMEKGWYYDQEEVCYYYFRQGSGAMERGWFYYGDEWYYFDQQTGRSGKGWLDYNGKTYYLNGDGSVHRGLDYDVETGGWYYFDENGFLQTGTITIKDIGITVETDKNGKISSDVDYLDKINHSINWFEQREGKVTYSMEKRNGPDSYDCSSALYQSLWAGNFVTRINYPGSTENLYKENGYLFKEISASEVRCGDVFISGVEGESAGEGGHTGIAFNNHSIYHCNYPLDGINLTPIRGYTVEHKYPVRWFRIVNQ